MKSTAKYHPLTSQVTLTVLALAAFSLAMVVGFGFYAALSADRNSLEKQKTFVAGGIADQVKELLREQESVADWDESVINARRGDQQWMADNLGQWLHDYYGHDRVYVLDAADRPIHAMQDASTVAPAAFEEDRSVIAASVAQVRAMLAAAARAGDPAVAAFGDLVLFEGRPAILAVQPLVPSSNRLAQAPGTEYLHVSVQFIDDELIGRIAGKYLLSGAHILPSLMSRITDASVPLVASSGQILGYVAWEQDRPGMTLIRKAGPALLVGGLLAAGVLHFLLLRLRRAAGELQRTQDEARYLAFHDTLTGLPNRALFEDRMKRALLAVERGNGRIALLYLDLDRFKNINDTFGHAVGDELVRQTATRLQTSVRQVDTVARLGGDEFAIIVFDIKNLAAAEELCDRLLGAIAAPYNLMGTPAYVGASIGVAMSSGAQSDSQDLLRKADIALYEAKRKGRGRHEVFAGGMDEVLTRKRIIETDLRAALDGGDQFGLVYQPVYAADCATLVGAEALVRWDHPVHAGLSPAHFLTIAEERGMIGLLGDWVLREAAGFAATTNLPWVSVNVSPLQLRDQDFPENLLKTLDEAGVTPSRLQLEITERVLLETSEVASSVLARLRHAGIRIALDDFGTGHSSIGYLRSGAVDKLKIDRSLVKLLGSPKDTSAIVKALVELGSAMQVTVTAEGVETVEQRDLLVAMACHELQGFLLSAPLSALAMRVLANADLSGSPLRSASIA